MKIQYKFLITGLTILLYPLLAFQFYELSDQYLRWIGWDESVGVWQYALGCAVFFGTWIAQGYMWIEL